MSTVCLGYNVDILKTMVILWRKKSFIFMVFYENQFQCDNHFADVVTVYGCYEIYLNLYIYDLKALHFECSCGIYRS